LDPDDRFQRMFFEEARELLISLEEGLVELERRQGDRAHLDRTFRAAHSIKGAAAMVGLSALADFTHGIEAVLDRIRTGVLAVDSDIITTLLEARDQLAALVDAEANKAPLAASQELKQRLAALLRDPNQPAPPPASAPSEPAPAAVAPGKPAKRPRKSANAAPDAKSQPKGRGGRARPPGSPPAPPSASPPEPDGSGRFVYRITLKPGANTLRRGINPLGVLDELRDLGMARITTDPQVVPPLAEIDPERCYLVWEIEVETDAGPDRLDDVFLFIAEDSTITIERRAADGSRLPAPPGSTASAPAPPIAPDTSEPALSVPAVPRPAARAPTAQPIPPVVQPVPIVSNGSTAPAIGPPPGVPLAPASSPPAAQAARTVSRIRVDAGQLDDLVGLAGELAVLSDNLQGLRDLAGALPWVHTLEALERVSRQVRETTLELRMVPVDELFSRFPRVVRDLADRFGKEIKLEMIGQDTRLDRTIVERLSDPMIHLIRNAVDHALETPRERLALGKPKVGRLTLWAGHEGDRVAIRVADDGRGLDRDRIVQKGIALGLVPTGTAPEDPRVDTLIFEAGFSTRDRVSELSGRGVGLDVVRDAVRALRGSLQVESQSGKGTAFIFKLPLTLALIDGLLVETAGARYVVPLTQVEECVALNGTAPALSRGRPCVAVRGELVPMVPLRRLFQVVGDPPARQELLLTRHAGQRVGVAVDRLIGRVQAVIQALGEGLAHINRFSGATILGDGSVSLILDLAALVTESRAADTFTTPPAGVEAEGLR
jgi:two-component system chemotaxis sensor kinase CheA